MTADARPADARHALVVGATGATAFRLVERLAASADWRVTAVTRRSRSPAPGVETVQIDLTDAGARRDAFAGLAGITHIFYAARAPHGEGGTEDVAANTAMLRAVIDGVEGAAASLRHVHLIEGGKWYGQHLGRYPTPAREDAPRHMPPNFYYAQQDLLEERSRGGGWTWSASRPNAICDAVAGRARNLPIVIGAYAAICRALAVPFDFPGSAASFDSLTEVTEARLLAEALEWIATRPEAAGRAFNVTNGDVVRWSQLWPVFADHFGVRPGIARPFRLAEQMQDKQPLWAALAAEHGLAEPVLANLANWAYADSVFAQDFDVMSDLVALRRIGFCGAVHTDAMFLRLFDDYRRLGYLPPAA